MLGFFGFALDKVLSPGEFHDSQPISANIRANDNCITASCKVMKVFCTLSSICGVWVPVK